MELEEKWLKVLKWTIKSDCCNGILEANYTQQNKGYKLEVTCKNCLKVYEIK